jgi:hypothetical protein
LNHEEQNFQAFASPAKDIVGDFERYQCFAIAPWGDRLNKSYPAVSPRAFSFFKQPHEHTAHLRKKQKPRMPVMASASGRYGVS